MYQVLHPSPAGKLSPTLKILPLNSQISGGEVTTEEQGGVPLWWQTYVTILTFRAIFDRHTFVCEFIDDSAPRALTARYTLSGTDGIGSGTVGRAGWPTLIKHLTLDWTIWENVFIIYYASTKLVWSATLSRLFLLFSPHVSVTSSPSSKNLALQPPQKSETHLALGWAGHLANWQGSTKQLTGGLSGGQVGGGAEKQSILSYTSSSLLKW